MSTQAKASPSPSPSSISSTSVTAVDFLNLVTQEYEPSASFFALRRTLDSLSNDNDTPPFVLRKPTSTAHLSGGVRAVTIFPENIQELFDLPDGADISNKLTLYEYDQGHTFWVLNAGSLKIIVTWNDGGFHAWLGPEEEFSRLRVAYSRKFKKTVDNIDGGTENDDEDNLSEEENMVEGGDGGAEDDDDDEDEDLRLELNDNTTLENGKASTARAALLLNGQAQQRAPPSAIPHNQSPQSRTRTRTIKVGTAPILNIRTKELKHISYFYQLASTLADSKCYHKPDCMTTKSPTLRRHPNGFIKVGLFEDEIKRHFGVFKDQVASELTLYQYGPRYAFWTMQVGNKVVIVKGNGRTFRAWLGPGKGYSAAVTTSDNSATSKATRVSDATQLDPDSGEADGPQDNLDDEDAEQTELDGTTLDPGILESEFHDKPLSKTLKRPITFGEAAIARKRPKTFTVPILSRLRLSNDKLDGTHFHVSINTNDYGPVLLSLRSCQKIDTFFSMVLRAWDLEDREAEIEAITVSFGWKPDEKTFVVKKNIPDSFDGMLKIIDEAPCWDEVGDVMCKVDVRIIMA